MACQAPEPQMQQPDCRQKRSGTCCLAAKKTVLAAEGERPRDPQSVARPRTAAECPGTTIIPHPRLMGEGSGAQRVPLAAGSRPDPDGPTLKANRTEDTGV